MSFAFAQPRCRDGRVTAEHTQVLGRQPAQPFCCPAPGTPWWQCQAPSALQGTQGHPRGHQPSLTHGLQCWDMASSHANRPKSGSKRSGRICGVTHIWRQTVRRARFEGAPFLLEALPFRMTGEPGEKVSSHFFLTPHAPKPEMTFLPFSLTAPAASGRACAALRAHQNWRPLLLKSISAVSSRQRGTW